MKISNNPIIKCMAAPFVALSRLAQSLCGVKNRDVQLSSNTLANFPNPPSPSPSPSAALSIPGPVSTQLGVRIILSNHLKTMADVIRPLQLMPEVTEPVQVSPTTAQVSSKVSSAVVAKPLHAPVAEIIQTTNASVQEVPYSVAKNEIQDQPAAFAGLIKKPGDRATVDDVVRMVWSGEKTAREALSIALANGLGQRPAEPAKVAAETHETVSETPEIEDEDPKNIEQFLAMYGNTPFDSVQWRKSLWVLAYGDGNNQPPFLKGDVIESVITQAKDLEIISQSGEEQIRAEQSDAGRAVTLMRLWGRRTDTLHLFPEILRNAAKAQAPA